MGIKQSDAQKWLETVDMNEIEPQYRPMMKYFKELISGKTPTEIGRKRNENLKNS